MLHEALIANSFPKFDFEMPLEGPPGHDTANTLPGNVDKVWLPAVLLLF